MERPILSVCIITYNHFEYIDLAIEGVLNQKVDFLFELIIADDKSTDGTREKLISYKKKYPDQIKLILQEKNVGPAKNWMDLITAPNLKYIAYLEGDDYWIDINKLQKQVDFLEANPEYGMVSSDIELVDANSQSIPDNNMVLRQRAYQKTSIDVFDLLTVNKVNSLTVMVRSNLIHELIARVQKENLWYAYDYWFWLHIGIHHKIKIIYDKTAAYRIHDKGISKKPGFLSQRSKLVTLDVLKRLYKNRKRIKLNKGKRNIITQKYLNLIIHKNNTFKIKVQALVYLVLQPFLWFNFLIIFKNKFLKYLFNGSHNNY